MVKPLPNSEVSIERLAIKQYEPLGFCAYCGDTVGPLSKEHIIPYSLNGRHVVPKASCPSCARLTSNFEGEVARMGYGYYRAVHDIATRRKARRTGVKAERVQVSGLSYDGHPVSAQVVASEVPQYCIVVEYGLPGILAGREPQAPAPCITYRGYPINDNELLHLRQKLGWQKIDCELKGVSPSSLRRLLAKIGYVYAVANFGNKCDASPLLKVLKGEDVTWHWTGGFAPEQPQSRDELRHRVEIVDGVPHLIVEISFHFAKRFPKYQAVCGPLREAA